MRKPTRIAPPPPVATGQAEALAAIRGNEILLGDCLAHLAQLPSDCIDMIYVDPPYFTRRDFQGRLRPPSFAGSGNGEAAKPESTSLRFTDRWQGGRTEYLHWLEARLRPMHRVLKPGGVFLLHLDWHAVHYAKVLCDQIFGDAAFINELIWHYQTGGASASRFSRKHDSILFYAKPNARGAIRHYFDGRAIAIPRGAGAMKRAQCPTGARIKLTDTHKNPDDVLIVPAINAMATERTGYPTQKPLQLLEKLVVALCPHGGLVADFFCGSGTTLVAAKNLGRRYVGCDVSKHAVALARQRLQSTALGQGNCG